MIIPSQHGTFKPTVTPTRHSSLFCILRAVGKSFAENQIAGYLRQNFLPHSQPPISRILSRLLDKRINSQREKRQSALNAKRQPIDERNQQGADENDQQQQDRQKT